MAGMKYTAAQCVRDFSVSNIAIGMEKVLSEGCTFERVKKGNEIHLISRTYENGYSERNTEIVIDEKYGELVRTKCSCGRFSLNYYECGHIHEILAKYLWETEGEEGLQGSDLEAALKALTKVDQPFIPGILRKTDASLEDFLSAVKKQNKILLRPSWEVTGEKTAKEVLSVEPILNNRDHNATLELKVGPKRRYIVRNLRRLLDVYQDGGDYKFSNSVTCPAGRSAYAEKDRPLMDFVNKIYMRQAGYEGNFYYGAQDSYREIFVAGRDLDAFLEFMEGKKIAVNRSRGGTKSFLVDLAAEPETFTLEKTTFGAMLKGERIECLARGDAWMYVCQGERLMKLPLSQWEERVALEDAMLGAEELYIQDKDLPALCNELENLGAIARSASPEQTGIMPYLPEDPQMQIYLDQPQDDMITCQVKAFYPSKKRTYNVLDPKKEKKNRNLRKELETGEQVWEYFSAYDEAGKQMCLDCDENRLFHFVTETIPALAKYGEVFISDKLKKLKVHSAPDLNVGIQVDAGNLVMSLHSNVMSKEDMIEILSSYKSKRRFTRLKNGEFVVFSDREMEMWATISETYRTYGRKNPEAMKLPLFRALYLEEALQDREDAQIETDLTYKQLIREIKGEETYKEEIPESLADTLREYQKEGFLWINMLKKNGFGGILADDMGLGKTLQVLSFLLSQKEKGVTGEALRTLIVAPASLIYNWKKEIEVFTPDLSCEVIAGGIAQRRRIISGIRDCEADIYITSYDLLKRDINLYEDITFANQVIDEAQYIKNQNTQVSKAVRLIQSSFRLALTGTPIENRLSELWSIFDYLMPGFLYGYTRFRSEFESPVINDHDEDALKRLRSMVHPFILRRLKKDVLKDLPDKLEETITVVLEGKQRKLYDAYAERLRLYLDKQSDEEFHQSKLEILAELTRLRQICCGPNVFLEDYKGESAKKETCMELVHQAVEGGHKILLFSQFTSVLDDLGERLKEEGIAFHRIDGSVNKEQRMKRVEAFAVDDVPLFLISLKAGGTGLNLTAADIVIHYDPWWNLAAQNQATDRTHRIGQENTVTVYQLIAEKTIEEQIAILQKTKAQLAEDILEGEGIASIMINKEEVLGLL